MADSSPLQHRQNILAAKAEIESVRQLLLANEKERHLALGYECVRTATQGLGVNNPIYRRIKSRTTIDVMGPRPVNAAGRG